MKQNLYYTLGLHKANKYWSVWILASFLVFHSVVLGQGYYDCNWQLGSASDRFSNPHPESLELSFGSAGIMTDTFFREASMNYFNASLSDDNGRLLLYSNGCSIRNADHTVIKGSESLNEGLFHTVWCDSEFGYPTFQGGIFLPFFGDSIVMLLHQRIVAVGSPSRPVIDSLFYTSLIRIDSGYTVLEKSVPIVGYELTDGNVEAVRAEEPNAWWVIQSEDNSNKYYSILLKEGRVDTVFSTIVGDSLMDGSAGGQACFSADGTKYARYSRRDDLALFDFDRSSGMLSHYRKIHVADSGFVGGLAFSPDSRFLYVSSQFDLYQLNTMEADVESSKIHIDHYDGYENPNGTYFFHMQLGPDCRIYMNSNRSTAQWHTIHEPNSPGKACDFRQHDFHFPVTNTSTMPNFPNYRLGFGPPCDPNLVTTIHPEVLQEMAQMSVYPNPTQGIITVELDDVYFERNAFITLEIYNALGRSVGQYRLLSLLTTLNLDLPYGIYFLGVFSDGKSVWTKRILVN